MFREAYESIDFVIKTMPGSCWIWLDLLVLKPVSLFSLFDRVNLTSRGLCQKNMVASVNKMWTDIVASGLDCFFVMSILNSGALIAWTSWHCRTRSMSRNISLMMIQIQLRQQCLLNHALAACWQQRLEWGCQGWVSQEGGRSACLWIWQVLIGPHMMHH